MTPNSAAAWGVLLPILLLARGALSVPPAPYGPLDVRAFGAKGDGATDDAPAIQRAIDEAQQVSSLGTAQGPSRPIYFPAGEYIIKSSLNIVSTHVKGSNKQLALALRLYGDGVGQSVIVAAAPMDAVLRFAGHGPNAGVAGVTTNGHTVESMKFDAAGLANYSVAATAITRSLFRYSDFSGARIAGLFLGYGWINDVLECYFTGNLIGVYLDNAVNSVNVVDGNFEGNYGVGIIANSGAMVRLEGNEFESQGGPGIIANGIQALTIRSNYFEANNIAGVGGNGHTGLSFGDHHTGDEEDVCTDILLNGNPAWGPERMGGPLVEARGSKGLLSLARIYLSNVSPNSGVIIAANSHSPGHDACLARVPHKFAGVFAAGAEGLQATSSHCGGCIMKQHHYNEVVLDICGDAGDGKACGGKNSLWTAVKSEAATGGYAFESAMHGTEADQKCFALNIPADLSMHGFQVVAYGAPVCPLSSEQSSFTLTGGVLRTKGFATHGCKDKDGCCIQAAQWSNTSNATTSSLTMVACDPTNPLQQFEVATDLKSGQIHDKLTGRCLAIKDCVLDVNPKEASRVCEAVVSGRAPDANSSLAEMVIQLNTGDFAVAG